jgi:hypothetical protein
MRTDDLEIQSQANATLITDGFAVSDSESTQPSISDSTTSSQNRSFWHRLRDQRREAAALVTLIVIAVIWFDSSSSKIETKSVSLDPLDGYEAVLSDFTPVGETQPMRESADPFESTQPIRHDGSSILRAGESPGSGSTADFNSSASYRGPTPATNADYSSHTPTLNTSQGSSAPIGGSDSQQPRRVRFAGRIQPTN